MVHQPQTSGPSDIAKWQMQKVPATLLDRTENVSDTKAVTDTKYNLHKRELVGNRPHSDRPQRDASKSVTYAKQTDESSQDLQIIFTIYPMDNWPIPDAKLEKIVGMSEPSAYRLSVQNYTEAKKRGEIPLPPKHTLPGYKAKSETEPENKTTVESADSEATEDYTPTELPDETKTEQPKPVRGKLKITKLTLKKPMPRNQKGRMFKCVHCGLLYQTIAELNEHFISKHWKLKCPDCDKTLTKPRSYQKHMYLHKKSKYRCDTCGKGFSFCSQLIAHLPVHSNLCEHHCTSRKCNKSFTHAGDLRKHEKTHSKKW